MCMFAYVVVASDVAVMAGVLPLGLAVSGLGTALDFEEDTYILKQILPHTPSVGYCMYVCVCVCVCMYVCMYDLCVCVHVCMICVYVCMYVCMYDLCICMYACMYACMYE
jgi:hypothetical protein